MPRGQRPLQLLTALKPPRHAFCGLEIRRALAIVALGSSLIAARPAFAENGSVLASSSAYLHSRWQLQRRLAQAQVPLLLSMLLVVSRCLKSNPSSSMQMSHSLSLRASRSWRKIAAAGATPARATLATYIMVRLFITRCTLGPNVAKAWRICCFDLH